MTDLLLGYVAELLIGAVLGNLLGGVARAVPGPAVVPGLPLPLYDPKLADEVLEQGVQNVLVFMR